MAEERNIIWTGEGEPPRTISIGILPTLEMPDEATQRNGFYSEYVLVLCKSVDGYKVFIGKGEVRDGD
jgi:hypothetical protein